jgi:hypothetical protein
MTERGGQRGNRRFWIEDEVKQKLEWFGINLHQG